MRKHNWRRPRKRVHPAKPKIGIRASRANETWHVDATLIRLLDGSKVYLHAVIDNFSRRILAWKASDQFDPSITAELLNQAASGIEEAEPPQLVVDGGVENYNASVDAAIISLNLKRVLAQTEVTFSNSMIEAWWRVLKHQWLFLNELDSLSKVISLVTFYVDQHNRHLPHAAFKGQTPDEMYFGTGSDIPEQLSLAGRRARTNRREINLATSCNACRKPPDVVPPSQVSSG
jgi:transposase InsO family protein